MAENTINDFNTLPEQVQINKEDIETNIEKIATNTANIATNTSDITKLKDDIGKIKPNAWEQRKFKINFSSTDYAECSTYNPITNESNPIVNIQRAFTDKDAYETTDSINSSSFSVSIPDLNLFIYSVCADPSLTLIELADMDFSTTSRLKNKIVFLEGANDNGNKIYSISINCDTAYFGKLSFHRNDSVDDIDRISDDDDKSEHSLLTAKAVDQYYLKKTDASNTYLSKTDASNTYATKTELSNTNKRIDALDTGTFDVDLTTAGFAKIKANVTIGTPITLTKDTDFSQYLNYTDYKTVIFTLYIDNNEEYFISTDIKLDVGYTADVYKENDQNYTWLTGIGVIKLGPNTNGNNYLCYISYSQGYTSPLVITPIQKLS